jgi:hypothetical protein
LHRFSLVAIAESRDGSRFSTHGIT